jgi:hypothetical protein
VRRLALALVGIVALATPLAVVGLVCWWLLVSAELPGRTWARRGMLGVLVVFAVDAGALTVLALLHQSCRPRVLVAALLLLALVRQVRRPARPRVPVAASVDAWALALGTLTFAVLYAPFVGAGSGRIMALLSRTTDGATHAQLVTAVQRSHGYVQLLHPPGLSAGVDHYPSAWHGNVWVVSSLLLGGRPSTHALLAVISACAVATFAFLSVLAAAVVLSVVANGENPTRRASLAGLACLSLLTPFGVGLLLLQLGSYTQLLAIAAVLGVVLLAAEPPSGHWSELLVAGACAVCLMQTWYLLALVVALPLTLLLLARLPSPRLLAGFLVVTVPLCLFPVVTGPSLTHVDAPGPETLPTLAGIMGLLVATGVGCLHAARGAGSLAGRALLAATVGSLFTLVALLLRDGSLAAGHLSYYAAKVLLSVLLIGGTSACVVVGARTRSASEAPTATALAVAMGLLVAAWTTRSLTLPPRVNNQAAHLDPALLEALLSDHPQGEPQGTISLLADGCDRVWDRIGTKWLADTTLTWSPSLSATLVGYAAEKRGEVAALERALATPDVEQLELYVRKPCDTAAIARLETEPKVRVIRVA